MRSPADSATQVLLGRVLGLILTLFLPAWTFAAGLTVAVSDRNGRGVADVVVTVSGLDKVRDAVPGHNAESSLVMDQLGMRFVPEVLVVPVGSAVTFPNSDSVSHQVYSFSKAKRFQLSLYKGTAHPPVNFDAPGLVVLGCNIHDQMAGYIYVTDAGWYGKTDANGNLELEGLPATELQVTIWSPRIADANDALTRHIKGSDSRVEFRLRRDLRGTPEPRPRNPDWDY